MAAPENWNITIKAGETFRERFMLKQEDGKPVDLTGATALCQIRKTAASGEVLAAPRISIIDAESGVMEIELSSCNSGALPTTGISCSQEDAWAWDAFIFYADGSSECLWDGEFRVRPRVTQ